MTKKKREIRKKVEPLPEEVEQVKAKNDKFKKDVKRLEKK